MNRFLMRATLPASIHNVTQCSYALFRFHPLYSVSKDTMISNIFSLSPKSHRHISVPSITESTIVSGESRVTLRVCLLGLLKGRRGNILAGSKTFRLRKIASRTSHCVTQSYYLKELVVKIRIISLICRRIRPEQYEVLSSYLSGLVVLAGLFLF